MARRRLLRNLVGSLIVLAVLGVIAFGLPAVDRLVPAHQPVAAGQPYEVGGGVTVSPPPGAVIDVTKTRPGQTRGSVLFLLGAVRYAIVVTPFDGSLPEAVERLRRKIKDVPGYQVAGAEFAVATTSGLRGLQGGYTAAGRDGRYAVFVVDSVAIEVTVSGADLRHRVVFASVEASTRSIAYSPGHW